jgi:hypothetical protein
MIWEILGVVKREKERGVKHQMETRKISRKDQAVDLLPQHLVNHEGAKSLFIQLA